MHSFKTNDPQSQSINSETKLDYVSVPRGTVEAFWLLTELTGELSAAKTLGELQLMLSQKLRWLFNFDSCFLAVKDGQEMPGFMLLDLKPGISRNKNELVAKLLPLTDNWISKVLRDSKAYYGNELELETDGALQPGIVKQVRSVMLVPLVSGGVCLGSLNFSSRQPAMFDSTARNIATIIGLQLGGHLGTILSLEHTRKTLQATREQLDNRLAYLSQNDAFTGLPNRRLLQIRLEEALQEAAQVQGRVAVVCLDINQFGRLNELLGETGGDQLLMALVMRLQTSLGGNVFLARSGDSEFSFILNNPLNSQEGSAFDFGPQLNRLIEALLVPYFVGNNELHLNLSLGMAEFPEQAVQARELLMRAQTALLQAKKSGRIGPIKYTPDLDISHELLFMESQLRKALERNELRVFYQPQYNIDGTQVVGMEALVRWEHPALGMVSPAQFIPIAEKSDLIIKIGHWVLEEACRQSVEWQQKGYQPLKMGVNLSYKQFEWPDLLPQVRATLEKTGLTPGCLELELTESLFVQDFEATLAKIRQLNELGIHIALDDFGTGYSSLSYLQKLPIDTLKIDQSFVRNLVLDSTNSADKTIVEAIIRLARGLKMEVIAEGVETVEQLKFLQDSGCDRMQGFLFSRPITASAIELMLTRITSPF